MDFGMLSRSGWSAATGLLLLGLILQRRGLSRAQCLGHRLHYGGLRSFEADWF